MEGKDMSTGRFRLFGFVVAIIALALALTTTVTPASAEQIPTVAGSTAPTKQVHFRVTCTPTAGHGYCNAELPEIPAGKRLFVTNVSVVLTLSPPGSVPRGYVFLRDDQGAPNCGSNPDLLFDYPLPITFQTDNLGIYDVYYGTHELSIYIDGGGCTPLLWASAIPSTGSSMRALVTGYLAPLP
jgi:hypothetical protein